MDRFTVFISEGFPILWFNHASEEKDDVPMKPGRKMKSK